MTDKKISELGTITQGDIASGDWVAVVDSSENATKKYNFGDTKTDVTDFFASTDTFTAGTYVRTRAEGFAYKAVDTATATTVFNAGGQNFEVLPGADGRMNLIAFNPALNGISDDKDLVQRLFDATPVGGTAVLGRGHRIKIVTDGSADRLEINKSINVDFNGSTLVHVANSGSSNDALRLESLLGPDVTWTETITSGQNSFSATNALNAGDLIFLELGVHPDDPLGAHFSGLATVTEATSTSFTVDRTIPYDIADTTQAFHPVTSVVEGVSISGLSVDMSETQLTAPNIQLALRRSRNVSIDTIKIKDGSIGISTGDGCDNIAIGTVVYNGIDHGTPTTGRVFTTYMSRNVVIDTLVAHSIVDRNMLFVEMSSDIRVGNAVFGRNLSAAPSSEIFQVDGGSRISFGQIKLASNQAERLYSLATPTVDQNTAYIERFVLRGDVSNANMKTTKTFEWNGQDYPQRRSLRREFRIKGDIPSTSFNLCTGFLCSMDIFVDTKTGLDAFFLENGNGNLKNILTDLTAGEFYHDNAHGERITSNGNPSYDVNDLRYPEKNLRIRTNSANTDVLVVAYVEYIPVGNNGGEGPVNGGTINQNWGNESVTPDVGGTASFAHGLSSPPNFVNVGLRGDNTNGVDVQSVTLTDIIVRIKDAAGADVTSGTYTVDWIAYA